MSNSLRLLKYAINTTDVVLGLETRKCLNNEKEKNTIYIPAAPNVISIKNTKKYDPKAHEGPRSRLSIAFVPEKRRKKLSLILYTIYMCAKYINICIYITTTKT